MRASARVKANEVAKKEFKRVNELLAAVGKNDALYESAINAYCMLKARIEEDENLAEEVRQNTEIPLEEKVKLLLSLQNDQDKCEKQRRAIERENIMTVSSAERSVPKKIDKTPNPLEALLNNGNS